MTGLLSPEILTFSMLRANTEKKETFQAEDSSYGPSAPTGPYAYNTSEMKPVGNDSRISNQGLTSTVYPSGGMAGNGSLAAASAISDPVASQLLGFSGKNGALTDVLSMPYTDLLLY